MIEKKEMYIFVCRSICLTEKIQEKIKNRKKNLDDKSHEQKNKLRITDLEDLLKFETKIFEINENLTRFKRIFDQHLLGKYENKKHFITCYNQYNNNIVKIINSLTEIDLIT